MLGDDMQGQSDRFPGCWSFYQPYWTFYHPDLYDYRTFYVFDDEGLLRCLYQDPELYTLSTLSPSVQGYFSVGLIGCLLSLSGM